MNISFVAAISTVLNPNYLGFSMCLFSSLNLNTQTTDPDIHLPKHYGVLQKPLPCENGVDLLFAIKSIPKNGDRRDGLRQSWLDPSLYEGVRI